MIDYGCEHYAGDEESHWCMKKGYFRSCCGCHKFKKQMKLRALIVQKFGTVRRFAQKVALSEAMMSKILNGDRVIMEWHYETFANVLGISVDELKGVIE